MWTGQLKGEDTGQLKSKFRIMREEKIKVQTDSHVTLNKLFIIKNDDQVEYRQSAATRAAIFISTL